MSNSNKVMLVKWLDSAGATGWMAKDDVPTEPLTCKSVGFLIADESTHVTLTLSLLDENEARKPIGDVIIIPKQSIVTVTELEEQNHAS